MAKREIINLTMTVLEMKSTGQRQSEWSDDDHKYKLSGPHYIRIVARMSSDEHSLIKMEIPSTSAGAFRVGEEIHVTNVTSVTS